MRPRRLELSGFTSFKEHTEIDFTGAEYFALVGPTGSGKSSIIDAITFALYGSVPRYDDRRLVAPVISHGKVEAKVLLEFSIDGKDYTAVRVVRRTPSGKGATTKEARLEADGEPLAGNADELSEQVAKLVGLSFDHFTRCVVLPQGEFARFLHDAPKNRQDLVVKLLNLGVYEHMRRLAAQSAAEKKLQLQTIQQKLSEELGFATPHALEEATARSRLLTDLRKSVSVQKPALEKVDTRLREALQAAEQARQRVKLVASLSVPEEIGELAARIEAAQKLVATTTGSAAAARKQVDSATTAFKKLPARAPLAAALSAHERRAKVQASLEDARSSLSKTDNDRTAARAEVAELEKALEAAERAQVEIQEQHRAQHLAAHLEKGAPCPVCLQPVGKIPKHPVVPGLKQADKAVTTARSALEVSRKKQEKADHAFTRAESALKVLADQLDELAQDLKAYPDASVIEEQLAAFDRAERAVEEARSVESDALDRADEARETLARLQQNETKERNRFESERDKVASLSPPPAARANLAEDWANLTDWAGEQVATLEKEAAAAEKSAQDAADEREGLLDKLLAACAECGLDVAADEDPLERVVEAQTSAKAEVKAIEVAISETKALQDRMKVVGLEQQTAHELSLHLSATAGRFENWLVNAALRRLVDGATEILGQLSNGQYALTTDESGNFLVVDRHNADEVRSARTLSGGETFLASLALALALADQLSDLAAEGGAKLEAIFLDEGFGTLDAETLDMVAATVENLAAGGRMVGIVTHVRELAERVPLQLRVHKDHRTSTIERVVA